MESETRERKTFTDSTVKEKVSAGPNFSPKFGRQLFLAVWFTLRKDDQPCRGLCQTVKHRPLQAGPAVETLETDEVSPYRKFHSDVPTTYDATVPIDSFSFGQEVL